MRGQVPVGRMDRVNTRAVCVSLASVYLRFVGESCSRAGKRRGARILIPALSLGSGILLRSTTAMAQASLSTSGLTFSMAARP